MRGPLEALVLSKVLDLVSNLHGADIHHTMIPSGDDATGLKNVCAKLTSELSDELDNVVSLLGISKRRFIEAALIDAIERANKIISDEGLSKFIYQPEN